MNFSFLTKILSVKTFADKLKSKIVDAFTSSFDNTNKDFGFESKPNPEIVDYLRDRQIILSQKTLDRLHGNLKLELVEGINNKESITDIKQRITPLFDNMEDYEIERIVRTEILNAQNVGVLESFKESGVVEYKIWKANIGNKRTGADSKRMHDQIQKLNDPFIDPLTGAECMNPPNRPNCRCFIVGSSELPKSTKKKNGILYIK